MAGDPDPRPGHCHTRAAPVASRGAARIPATGEPTQYDRLAIRYIVAWALTGALVLGAIGFVVDATLVLVGGGSVRTALAAGLVAGALGALVAAVLAPVAAAVAAGARRLEAVRGASVLRVAVSSLAGFEDSVVELFDLQSDPDETQDRVNDHPEVAAELWRRLAIASDLDRYPAEGER